jgi:hypothetical protein
MKLRMILGLLLLALLSVPALAQEGVQRTSVTRLPAEVKTAINRGLEHFATSQNENGSWGAGNRPAGTALGLMSFMLQGHIPGDGKYGKQMSKAIDFLISIEKNGYLHDDTSRGMYEHGLAMLALSEAWGQSRDPRIREVLIRAVNVTLNAQNSEGGWRYGPRGTSADVSCTAMQLVALASAREAGIAVPRKTIKRATDYLIAAEVRSTGGFSYQILAGAPMGAAGYGRSAAATLSLMLCGQREHPAAKGGIAYVHSAAAINYQEASNYWYSHYYAAQAMYQAGDKYFNRYYQNISKVVLTKQDEDGSWGRSHVNTGFAILILGVPYRFLPIYQK